LFKDSNCVAASWEQSTEKKDVSTYQILNGKLQTTSSESYIL
jgi:hypothetical protein